MAYRGSAGDLLTRSLEAKRLSPGGIMSWALTSGTPLTVVAGVIPLGYAATGVTGVPIAFVTVGVILAVFAVGYTTMARRIGNAGAFYAYIAGASRRLAVGAAWLATVGYNILQIALYGAIGAATSPLTQRYLGVSPPWWVIALIAWAITAVLGALKVDLTGRLLAALVLAELAIIAIYSVADLVTAPSLTVQTLSPHNLTQPGFGALIALAVLGYVGFETCPVFSEEASNPRRSVPMATYAVIAVTAVTYTLSAWAMSLSTGPSHIVAASRSQGTDLIFTLAGRQLGDRWADAGHILFAASILAAAVSFHGSSSRYMFALGRERLLPAALGNTSTASGAPIIASLVQSTIGLIVIVAFALAGGDPLVHLFYWGGTIGGLCILVLLTLTSAAIVIYFRRTPDHGESMWATLAAPLLAFIALGTALVLALHNLPTLFGVSVGSSLTWIVPVGIVVVLALGTIWGHLLSRTQPAVYAGIGQGAAAVKTRTSMWTGAMR